MKYTSLTLCLSLLSGTTITTTNAFTPSSTNHKAFLLPSSTSTSTQQPTSTQLYIIGPMLRKMREQNAQNKMPMASDEEKVGEADGLRVGDNAWKWPPVWPYDTDAFTPKADIEAPPPANANPIGALIGQPQLPPEATAATATAEEEEKEEFDVVKYWTEEKGDVLTAMDDEAAKKLSEHFAFYLKDGMEVLELGAAENSYLPESLKLSKHVGIGLNQNLMNTNKALTETHVVNLNNVIEEQGINSTIFQNELGGENSFDAIIMSNTIDFLTNPREVFRTAWYMLKPGGLMMVPFMNKDAYSSKFERVQTKMWKDFNDDQHMWVIGSIFQFSAGDGWDGLKGFDISPDDAKPKEGINAILNRGKMNVYVVQARKAMQEESIDPNDPEQSFRSKMWLMPTLEDRDKKLLAPRLSRSYDVLKDDDASIEALERNVEALPKIYESLIKMDQFAFTFSMQSQLAADLVTDASFEGNDEQIIALKMGLGLRTPSKEFWEPVGQKTANMIAEDKINLLAHIVPRFGSNDPQQETALENFVSGLDPTFDTIRSKCPSMSEADVQLIGTELLAAEILIPGRSTKTEFASWVAALTEEEILAIMDKRRSFKKDAVVALEDMREKRQAERDRLEAEQKKFQDQLEKAREERSIALNVKNGKMELVEN